MSFKSDSILTLTKKKAKEAEKARDSFGEGRRNSIGGNAAGLLRLSDRIEEVAAQVPGGGSFATLADVANAQAAAEAAAAVAAAAADAAQAAVQQAIDDAQDQAAAAEELNDQAEEAATDAEQAVQDAEIDDNEANIASLSITVSSLGANQISLDNALTAEINQTNLEQTAQDLRLDALELHSASIANHDDVDVTTNPLSVGDVLVWDGVNFVPGTAASGSTDDFQVTFDASDWTTGSPNVLTIPQLVHMLPYNAGEIYTVTVADATGCQVEVTVQTNLVNGDVTISSVGPTFDGIIRIF